MGRSEKSTLLSRTKISPLGRLSYHVGKDVALNLELVMELKFVICSLQVDGVAIMA